MRCKCDCNGELHGTRPGPVYRWAAEPLTGSGGPDPALIKQVDDVVVKVLAELAERSPTDMKQVADTVEDVLAGQAWKLILDGKPPKRRMSRRHWLCSILADIAMMLDELTNIPGALGDAVYNLCRELGWGKLRSRAAAEIVERLAQLAFAQALAPVSTLVLKIKIAALMMCPDPEKHQQVTRAFASDLHEAMDLD